MNYEDIFQARGGSYHEAMRRWPDARVNDFVLPLSWVAPQAGERVIDVPAGGGYLREFLPDPQLWFGHEPCASFLDDTANLDGRLLPLPYEDDFADVAISIAGVHHLEDKSGLFDEWHRVLKPGGRLMLADVHAESAVAQFLDRFVGRHNSTGHEGVYLSNATPAELAGHGFSIVRAERVNYPWWFRDRAAMGAFCRSLFDMQGIGADAVADVIERDLGVQSRDGRIGMNWELYFVLATPAG